MSRNPSAADRAHAYVRGGIMDGTYPPGAMLSENEVAAALSMSRTPVRAALVRLQDEGWVRIYAQRGALVRELTPTEIRESAEVRHALESAGVRRAGPREREQLAEDLAAQLDEQEQALRDGDFPTFTTLAMRFHRSFVELGGNATMLALYDRLQDRQQLSIIHSVGRISDDPRQVIAEHRALLVDAEAGDWAAFASHLDEHQSRSHALENGSPVTTGRR
ncbi:GntR family transcriptional regulator [Kribbella sp.]|uniref:GntR family transcriptional regulator n=1 Tax=Kribbella sp. TaxID=1871183 RepID=UPI002D42EA73|nr:GntR family transcriptional regulator [Kribbella sp.]HZX08796.1 GntR family transcriptional regulator [Kribbella sp.]